MIQPRVTGGIDVNHSMGSAIVAYCRRYRVVYNVNIIGHGEQESGGPITTSVIQFPNQLQNGY